MNVIEFIEFVFQILKEMIIKIGKLNKWKDNTNNIKFKKILLKVDSYYKKKWLLIIYDINW